MKSSKFNSVWPYGDKQWVGIGSGHGLLPDGTKPLLWTNVDLIIGQALWHSPKGKFTRNSQDTYH